MEKEKYITDEEITSKMLELQEKIKYKFNNIKHLKDAMNATLMSKTNEEGKHKKDYFNDALGTVGDALIKFLLSDYLYEGTTKKGEISQHKEKMENNEVLYKIIVGEGWINYAYNKTHFREENDNYKNDKVSDKKHSQYLEAITASIYYDGGFNAVKKWFNNTLLELLEKYKKVRLDF